MQLAYKLWRQIRVIGDLRLHFLVCWCCYLQRKFTNDLCKKGRIFRVLKEQVRFEFDKETATCIWFRVTQILWWSEIALTCSLWPWGKYTTRLPTAGKETSGPAQACHNSEFRHLCSSTAVMAKVFKQKIPYCKFSWTNNTRENELVASPFVYLKWSQKAHMVGNKLRIKRSY